MTESPNQVLEMPYTLHQLSVPQLTSEASVISVKRNPLHFRVICEEPLLAQRVVIGRLEGLGALPRRCAQGEGGVAARVADPCIGVGGTIGVLVPTQRINLNI